MQVIGRRVYGRTGLGTLTYNQSCQHVDAFGLGNIHILSCTGLYGAWWGPWVHITDYKFNQIPNATSNTFLNNSKPAECRLIPFKPWLDETQVLRSFYADLRKSCRNAGFTQTCVKAVETQVLRSFYAGLRKSCRNAAFTQVCVKAVETQLLRRSA